MITKSILLFAFVGIICQGSLAHYAKDIKSLASANFRFDLNVDGSKIPYQIDLLTFDYNVKHLDINRDKDSNSAEIKLRALLGLTHGDPISDKNEYTPYTFIRGQFLNVKIVGTAKLLHGGPYVRDCKFSFTQVPPIEDEIPTIVKDTALENLNDLIGEKLCRSINETI